MENIIIKRYLFHGVLIWELKDTYHRCTLDVWSSTNHDEFAHAKNQLKELLGNDRIGRYCVSSPDARAEAWRQSYAAF